jgi:hypothetical protein
VFTLVEGIVERMEVRREPSSTSEAFALRHTIVAA